MAELTPAQQQQLAAAVEAAYAVWLPTVEAAVLAGYLKFGIVPDPAAINTTAAVWAQQVQQLEDQQLEPLGADAYHQEDPGGGGNLTDALIIAAAAATTAFLMAQVGEVQAQLVTIVATAVSVAAAVAAIRLFLAASNQHWRDKADLIAWTEGGRWVEAATLQGALNASRRDGKQRVKVWVSKDDNKVRPTHFLADGQQRELLAPFNVGGFPMMYPHDPRGPVQEVANCRCGLRIKVVAR